MDRVRRARADCARGLGLGVAGSGDERLRRRHLHEYHSCGGRKLHLGVGFLQRFFRLHIRGGSGPSLVYGRRNDVFGFALRHNRSGRNVSRILWRRLRVELSLLLYFSGRRDQCREPVRDAQRYLDRELSLNFFLALPVQKGSR